MNSERGLLIVFEGLDRCGKSTQVKLLQEYFENQNLNSKIICFPDRTTKLGTMISNYLKGKINLTDEMIHLLFSANRWEKYDEMLENLKSGTHLICDRYTYSGVAFSAAKGLPFEWCKGPDSRLIAPDLTIYLQAPQSTLSLRCDFGSERYENIEFQNKVRVQFEKLIKTENMAVVKADQSVDQVHQDIVDLIQKKLDEERNAVKLLWEDIYVNKEQN